MKTKLEIEVSRLATLAGYRDDMDFFILAVGKNLASDGSGGCYENISIATNILPEAIYEVLTEAQFQVTPAKH